MRVTKGKSERITVRLGMLFATTTGVISDDKRRGRGLVKNNVKAANSDLLKTKPLCFSLLGQLLLLSPFLLRMFSFEPLSLAVSLPFPWPLSPIASALLPLS